MELILSRGLARLVLQANATEPGVFDWYLDLPFNLQIAIIAIAFLPAFFIWLVIHQIRTRGRFFLVTIWHPDQMIDKFWGKTSDGRTFERDAFTYFINPKGIGIRRYKRWFGLRTGTYLESQYVHNNPNPLVPGDPDFTVKEVTAEEINKIINMKIIEELSAGLGGVGGTLLMVGVAMSVVSALVGIYVLTQIGELSDLVRAGTKVVEAVIRL